MKYLITESQLENAVFRFLDNQEFIDIDKDGTIYFFNSGDEYAKIKYAMNNHRCIVAVDLIMEICSFFSLDMYDAKDIVKEWIENELQTKVNSVDYSIHPQPMMLRIPY